MSKTAKVVDLSLISLTHISHPILPYVCTPPPPTDVSHSILQVRERVQDALQQLKAASTAAAACLPEGKALGKGTAPAGKEPQPGHSKANSGVASYSTSIKTSPFLFYPHGRRTLLLGGETFLFQFCLHSRK